MYLGLNDKWNSGMRSLGSKAKATFKIGEKAVGAFANFVNKNTTGKTLKNEQLTDEERMLHAINR
jgi:hypothetical protein